VLAIGLADDPGGTATAGDADPSSRLFILFDNASGITTRSLWSYVESGDWPRRRNDVQRCGEQA